MVEACQASNSSLTGVGDASRLDAQQHSDAALDAAADARVMLTPHALPSVLRVCCRVRTQTTAIACRRPLPATIPKCCVYRRHGELSASRSPMALDHSLRSHA